MNFRSNRIACTCNKSAVLDEYNIVEKVIVLFVADIRNEGKACFITVATSLRRRILLAFRGREETQVKSVFEGIIRDRKVASYRIASFGRRASIRFQFPISAIEVASPLAGSWTNCLNKFLLSKDRGNRS